MDSPSHLRMLVKTQVVAGMFSPMAKVSVANKHCTTKHSVSNKSKNEQKRHTHVSRDDAVDTTMVRRILVNQC